MDNFVNGQWVVGEYGHNYVFVGYIPNSEGECVVFSQLFRQVEVVDEESIKIRTYEFKYWNVFDEHIKYLAKDANGSWYGYLDKPEKDMQGPEEDHGWTTPYLVITSMANISDSCFPDVDWEDSLIKRPEGE